MKEETYTLDGVKAITETEFGKYKSLFDYMFFEHNVILVESEIEEIKRLINAE